MSLPVVTVAAGGLAVVEVTAFGLPVIEATNGRGIAVTKVIGKPGLPVTFEGGGGPSVLISPNNMTSNVLPAPYVASASTTLASNSAYLCFNSSLNWYWLSNGGPPQWVKIDLGSAQSGSRYELKGPVGTTSGQPTAWTLEGSNNDSTWTVADTRTGQPVVAAGGLIGTYTMAIPGTYRYWRWTFTVTSDTSAPACGNIALYS
jgi:hypothetical protein